MKVMVEIKITSHEIAKVILSLAEAIERIKADALKKCNGIEADTVENVDNNKGLMLTEEEKLREESLKMILLSPLFIAF